MKRQNMVSRYYEETKNMVKNAWCSPAITPRDQKLKIFYRDLYSCYSALPLDTISIGFHARLFHLIMKLERVAY